MGLLASVPIQQRTKNLIEPGLGSSLIGNWLQPLYVFKHHPTSHQINLLKYLSKQRCTRMIFYKLFIVEHSFNIHCNSVWLHKRSSFYPFDSTVKVHFSKWLVFFSWIHTLYQYMKMKTGQELTGCGFIYLAGSHRSGSLPSCCLNGCQTCWHCWKCATVRFSFWNTWLYGDRGWVPTEVWHYGTTLLPPFVGEGWVDWLLEPGFSYLSFPSDFFHCDKEIEL